MEKFIDECGLNVDSSKANERCWCCGCEHNLEHCNIVLESLVGKDELPNLVLLYHRCHLDNPNITDPEIMWDCAYGVLEYNNTFGI